ncbi:MAG TPA: hypothetical protein ENO23_03640 [Alphaproteobacteria bacterium]|nr:hypothetical protein [Alphaproteobacteria bacterium]
MLQATVARIDDDDVPRLRDWLAALAARREELEESYRTHGTRHELFLLVRTPPRPLLVVIAEVDDDQAAVESFLRSELPIDVEFKSLVQDMSPTFAEVELLYDSSTLVGDSASVEVAPRPRTP